MLQRIASKVKKLSFFSRIPPADTSTAASLHEVTASSQEKINQVAERIDASAYTQGIHSLSLAAKDWAIAMDTPS